MRLELEVNSIGLPDAVAILIWKISKGLSHSNLTRTG